MRQKRGSKSVTPAKQGFTCWIPATEGERERLKSAATRDGRTVGSFLLQLFRVSAKENAA